MSFNLGQAWFSTTTDEGPRKADSKLSITLSPSFLNQGNDVFDNTIYAGEEFFLHTSFRRANRCPSLVLISLSRTDANGAPILLEKRTNWMPIGDFEMNEKLKLPSYTDPGDYRLLMKAHSLCDLSLSYSIIVDLPLHVKVSRLPK